MAGMHIGHLASLACLMLVIAMVTAQGYKPGQCPTEPIENPTNCTSECTTDHDGCTGEDICCDRGCAYKCVAPRDGIAGGSNAQKSIIACENNRVALTCSSGYRIRILAAFWGRGNSDTCSQGVADSEVSEICSGRMVMNILEGRCANKQSCRMQSSTGVLGDPCQNLTTIKYLKVEYECEPIQHDALVCENSGKLSFACPDKKVIVTNSAFFGRDDYNTTCPHLTAVGSSYCAANYSDEVFRQMCSGKTQCEMDARVQSFGDPCPGSYKYLRLKYSCVDCINEYGDDAFCEFYANRGDCAANPWMTVNCRKSCWKCDKEPMPNENAWGNDENCIGWAAEGQCTSNWAWMTAYCRKACLEKDEEPLTECLDKYDIDFGAANGENRCPGWYKNGECASNNYHYMHWDCTKSCFGCNADNIIRCEDKNKTQCEKWALAGECARNTGFMIANCLQSCVGCTSDPVCKNNPEIDLPCPWDTTGQCQLCDYWESIGECDANPIFMHVNCWKSCLKCSGVRNANVNAWGKDEDCAAWAEEGLCTSNWAWMTSYCRKACLEKNIKPLTECVNLVSDATCEYYRSIGECNSNTGWMLNNCRKSCTKCDLPVDEVAECLNVYAPSNESYATCDDYRPTEECIVNPGWMLPNCRASCTECDNPAIHLNKTGPVLVPGTILSDSGVRCWVLPGYFPARAKLTHFGVHFGSRKPVHLMIWRPDRSTEGVFAEVYNLRVQPQGVGAQTVLIPDCVQVEAGDQVGFCSLSGDPSPITVNLVNQNGRSELTSFRIATSIRRFVTMEYPYRFALYAGYNSTSYCSN